MSRHARNPERVFGQISLFDLGARPSADGSPEDKTRPGAESVPAALVTVEGEARAFVEPGAKRPQGGGASRMRVVVLGSGSGGNSVVIESGHRRLMVDAGFSCRELERRLAVVGVAPDSLDALILTHEHGDHSRGAERLARRHDLEVFATAGTLRAESLRRVAARAVQIRSGEPFRAAGFSVEGFGIPHDAREPIGLVVEDEAGGRVGLAADLGCRSQLAWARLEDLDVLILETNHDLGMLRDGPYPWHLKQRVASRHGHLSNREAAEGLGELVGERLRWVVLYHLSRTNNQPALAAAAIQEALDEVGSSAGIVYTSQDHPTDWLEATPFHE